jgi:hypothetical protein
VSAPSNAADGLVKRVSSRNRFRLTGPVDRGSGQPAGGTVAYFSKTISTIAARPSGSSGPSGFRLGARGVAAT